MIITWYGQSCFKLQDTQQTILVDPYSPRKAGLRGPNFKATLLILTDPEDEKTVKKDLKEDSFLISSPGEYEIRDIFVYGTAFLRKKKRLILYQIEVDNIRFGVLGEIDSSLTSEELEVLDGIDVLFVPIGGKNMINAEKAIEIINSIDPRIIIPCCYRVPKIKLALDPLEKFLREMGIKKTEKLSKLSLRKKDLPLEGAEVVILEPRV